MELSDAFIANLRDFDGIIEAIRLAMKATWTKVEYRMTLMRCKLLRQGPSEWVQSFPQALQSEGPQLTFARGSRESAVQRIRRVDAL